MRRILVCVIAIAWAFTACNSGSNPASPANVETLTLLKPVCGEVFHIGDTVAVSVEYRNSADSTHTVSFSFSSDNGRIADRSIFSGDIAFAGQKLDTSWVIPNDYHFGSDSAKIKVEDAHLATTLFAWSGLPFTVIDTFERVVMLTPNGGESYRLGDTVPISVEYRHSTASSHFVQFWFSPDNGLTMDFNLFPRSFTFQGQKLDTFWVIPNDTYYVTDSASIKVEDYSKRTVVFDFCDGAFRVTNP